MRVPAAGGAARRRILVVDDDRMLADMVATALRFAGFETATAATGRETIARCRDRGQDLIVLDVALPDTTGWELCGRLRRLGIETPVIFLTARRSDDDKLRGLTVGDDYITKPFSLDELVARIRMVLRRTTLDGVDEGRLVVGDLELDEDGHRVRRGGRPIELSPTEFALLRYLMLNAGRVLSKEQILQGVWDYDFQGRSTVVATYVSYLRRKLEQPGERLIHTVPGIGYVLRRDDE
jgi:two-component system OmpR family response regulator